MSKEFKRKDINEIKAETPANWNGKTLAEIFSDSCDTEKEGHYCDANGNFIYVFKVYWKGVYTRIATNYGKVMSSQLKKRASNSKEFKKSVSAYVDHMENNLCCDLYEKFESEVYQHAKERKQHRADAMKRWLICTVPEVDTWRQKKVLANFYGLTAHDPRIRKMNCETVTNLFTYYIGQEIINRHDAKR